ncbi:hypothetical protein CR513_30677, partial [Mucuna pruriens]
MVVTYKDWHDMIPCALHGYRTSVQTSIGATPYLLVYGMEAVFPVEVEIPSLRILVEVELDEVEWKKNDWQPCVMASFIRKGLRTLLTREQDLEYSKKGTWCSKRYC